MKPKLNQIYTNNKISYLILTIEGTYFKLHKKNKLHYLVIKSLLQNKYFQINKNFLHNN